MAIPIEYLAAVIVAAYLVFITAQRLMNDDDPSIVASASTSVGSFSFLTSGAFVALWLALFVAVLTWPAPVERPVFGLVLAGTVGAHVVIEWREAM